MDPAIGRLRDAIQDVLFYGRLQRGYSAELVTAIGEACAALAYLPEATVTKLEALDERPEWPSQLRMTLFEFSNYGKPADAKRLVEMQDQLLAIGGWNSPHSA